MAKEFSMKEAPKKLEPRTWAFPAKDEALVSIWIRRRMKANQRLSWIFNKLDGRASARFSRKLIRVLPALNGKNIKLMFNRDGKPYAEEVL
jgi:hypothetical protein